MFSTLVQHAGGGGPGRRTRHALGAEVAAAALGLKVLPAEELGIAAVRRGKALVRAHVFGPFRSASLAAALLLPRAFLGCLLFFLRRHPDARQLQRMRMRRARYAESWDPARVRRCYALRHADRRSAPPLRNRRGAPAGMCSGPSPHARAASRSRPRCGPRARPSKRSISWMPVGEVTLISVR